MKTVCVIINYNFPEITDSLYERLAPYQGNSYELMVLDNGSKENMVSKYTRYKSPVNTYFGGALTYAFQIFNKKSPEGFDSLMVMNNDLIVHGYNFIRVLQEEMQATQFTIVSPCIIQNSSPWKCIHNWGARVTRPVPWVDFQCPLFHKRFVEKYPVFASKLPWFGSDVYAGLLCQRENWKIGVVDRVCAYHMDAKTFNEGRSELSIGDYCRAAEETQRDFFASNQIWDEINKLRQESFNYSYTE